MKRQILALTTVAALTAAVPSANAQPGDPGAAAAAGIIGGLVGGLLLGPPPPPPPHPRHPPAPPVYDYYPGPPPAGRYYDRPPAHFSRGYADGPYERSYERPYREWDE